MRFKNVREKLKNQFKNTSEKMKKHAKNAYAQLKKYSFHITLLILFTLPIIMLVFFDYFNIESLGVNFNTKFVFEETWKGRMFYLFFIWLMFIESIINLEKIVIKRPENRIRLGGFFIFVLIPTIYLLSVNFLGLGQTIIKFGEDLGIQQGFVLYDWPLSLEYLVFTISFSVAIILAYKGAGLKFFSISLSLLGGITAFYLIDTAYPFGVFKPLQLLALPAAASTAALFRFLGYSVILRYPYPDPFPWLYVASGGKSAYANVGWPCAGVHSMFLYVLIMLVFFKRSEISGFRKLAYFIIGAGGTYFVNILRIYSILVIMMNYGGEAGTAFHNSYGELYFITWMVLYILLIFCIQRFMLVEKTRHAISKLGSRLRLRKTEGLKPNAIS